ncbi:tripartite tricarboxylate transporter permease [Bacillus carboniphilus]|uniref:Tripartite tricarboxylate transporter permease n=1 Tax=Bacillus carboniphilus TaxID=86663 RepID=A0ABP3FUD8_9BACI
MTENIVAALSMAFSLNSILFIFIGVLGGIIFGSIPGLTATMGVAILIPLTYGMAPHEAILLLAGVYNGAMYGGSIAAILVNIPGTPSSIATNLDGYPMAKSGNAGRAVGLATVGSFLGGLFSVIVLTLAAPQLAKAALMFSAPEYFALAIFGLSIIASISGKSVIIGLLAGLLGMFIATIGMDPIESYPRFTFGSPNLLGGIDLLPLMIGLFGLSEVMMQVVDKSEIKVTKQKLKGVIPKLSEIMKYKFTIFRSSVIGTFIGAVPAAGGPIASLLAYNEAKRTSKRGENFGNGEGEGIVAAETANNATCGGALIPLMTLSIPGDGVTAVMLGAFMIHNIQPGPLLFRDNGDLVFSIFIGMGIAVVFLLILGLLGAGLFARALSVPKHFLMPGIVLLCVVGSYAVRNSLFDVIVMLVMGFVGFLMLRAKIPLAPVILGLILGPMAEANFRRAMLANDGNPLVFITSPISGVILLITVIVLFMPLFKKMKINTKKNNNHTKSIE